MGLKGAVRVNHPLITCSSARSRNKSHRTEVDKTTKPLNKGHEAGDSMFIYRTQPRALNPRTVLWVENKAIPVIDKNKKTKTEKQNTLYKSTFSRNSSKTIVCEVLLPWVGNGLDATSRGPVKGKRSQFVTRPESLKRSAKSLLRGIPVQVNADQVGLFRF